MSEPVETWQEAGQAIGALKSIPDGGERILLLWSTVNVIASPAGRDALKLDDDACDLGVLNSGAAPLLLDHIRAVDSVVGVIEKAWIDTSGEMPVGRAVARMSRRPRAQEILTDIRDGVLRTCSVGFSIYQIEARDSHHEITRWRPYEISVVATPHDHACRISTATTWDSAAKYLDAER